MSLNLSQWKRPDTGALFVVSGASGTGKTTLLREALGRVPDIGFSVSATTRRPRPGERDGVDYHFLDPDRFQALVEQGAFLEWAEVYGNRYGTLRAPVEEALLRGESIILDIDVQGARQVREAMPECVSIFLAPTSITVLEQRLRARGTESEDTVATRMGLVQEQLDACGEFQYIVVNDVLESAHDCLQAVLISELQRVGRRQSVVRGLVSAEK
ncbi:MAG: guanylate kinase [Myxococcota bacterium]|nr:guanylate kinase [Myxococcota bacterium]